MATKYWKHEKDCKRTEALIAETTRTTNKPGWGHCAMKVLVTLRTTRPRATPLALHFIDISATEMLSGRHAIAKLCFLAAQAIADSNLMAKMAVLFYNSFSSACDCEACQRRMALFKQLGVKIDTLEEKLKKGQFPPSVASAIQAAMAGMGDKMNNLPDGLSEIELLPGLKAHVIKQSFGTPPAIKKGKGKSVLTPPDGNSRWN